jgi:hypothetical protein
MNIYCFSTLSFAKLQFKSVINKAFHKHGVASFTDAWIETPYSRESKVRLRGNEYICCDTNKAFDVKTKTIFFKTSIPLIKWFKALWLVLYDDTINSVEMGRKLEVTQKTAWEMMRRIKFCLTNSNCK